MPIYERYNPDFFGRHQIVRGIGDEAANRSALKQRAAATLERLRYHTYSSATLAQRYMQRLGDWGRAFCGFLHPRQTGGGWW